MTDSTLLAVRAVGRPGRGRILAEYPVRRKETDETAHMRVMAALMEHEQFMGVEGTSGDTESVLEIGEGEGL